MAWKKRPEVPKHIYETIRHSDARSRRLIASLLRKDAFVKLQPAQTALARKMRGDYFDALSALEVGKRGAFVKKHFKTGLEVTLSTAPSEVRDLPKLVASHIRQTQQNQGLPFTRKHVIDAVAATGYAARKTTPAR